MKTRVIAAAQRSLSADSNSPEVKRSGGWKQTVPAPEEFTGTSLWLSQWVARPKSAISTDPRRFRRMLAGKRGRPGFVLRGSTPVPQEDHIRCFSESRPGSHMEPCRRREGRNWGSTETEHRSLELPQLAPVLLRAAAVFVPEGIRQAIGVAAERPTTLTAQRLKVCSPLAIST
ncbi:hypothetical protein L596_000826 [Steinernema carpocapsae]|uniref:Uncharacterized protein n=1 Tax=Steinernema carpocapsae TaxID=34508 RepID=A0A4U8UJC6_STECR|nr:hypothetical protein L596_000826 [Steinernema carpocapsae]